MLIYAGRLPQGALVRPDVVTRPAAPIWFDAGEGLELAPSGRMQGWTAREGRAEARPVAANATGTRVEGGALAFQAGECGGLVVAGAVPDAAAVTFGAILTPRPPEARSLLSLQPLGSEDYIFLSLEGDRLRLARRGAEDAVVLTLPAPSGPLLILCRLTDGQARISANGQAATGPLAVEATPADLYIGCRNGKGGMKGKLGSFTMTDLLIWPQGGDTAAAEALWRERCSLDL